MCLASNERGKWHLTDGMELTNQDKIRTIWEKETYKYLGILEADTITQVEMKEKIKKEHKFLDIGMELKNYGTCYCQLYQL